MLTDAELEAVREAARHLSFSSPDVTRRLDCVIEREVLRRKRRDELRKEMVIADEV